MRNSIGSAGSLNFQKVSAVLADFGYMTIPLSNDWSRADFIAQTADGSPSLKVQLKSRLTLTETEESDYTSASGMAITVPVYYEHASLWRRLSLAENLENRDLILRKPYHFPASLSFEEASVAYLSSRL